MASPFFDQYLRFGALTYYAFPDLSWQKIRTNPFERLSRCEFVFAKL
jgi:hypothetical protein